MESGGTVLNLDELRQWIGRTESAEDVITPRLERSFRATFNRAPGQPAAGDVASPCIHWCLAPAIAPTDALGDDGHPRCGGFLPPAPLPRRMWAGGELHFISPLHVGDVVTRTSRIDDVALKEGRAGPLCFVTVRHVWSTALGPAVEERQEIVYRGIGGEKAGATKPEAAAPTEAMWRQSWACDPVLVFRYSAITYNSHRIHYDHAYATGVEGYPDLVVNGPLQATVMAAYAH